ncbi:MAG: serine acetyltransferase [Candidatus Riflebacteria bacterium HGW-Riflebacteria-2]|nr:MAG: serine acetyltransferase [Candidatus Riflebacteria bacterium HGW-Riflebacteria-2]
MLIRCIFSGYKDKYKWGQIMKKSLKKIVDGILRSINQDHKEVQHFDSSPLPDKDIIYDLIRDIFIILYPGYFGHSEMSFATIDMRIGYRVARVFEELKPQVHRELIHGCKRGPEPCGQCEHAADMIVLTFLENIPALRASLDLDIKAAFVNDPAAVNYDEIIFSYPGLEAVSVYRVAHFFYTSGLRLIPRIMTEWAHSRTGVDIHPGAQIGKSFFIDHGTGVVIGETTVIGDNVTLYQGVTLGALNFPRDKNGQVIRRARRHPTIGDSVVIYAGATILGGETFIGENSVIGGNVWLTESVPADSRVILGNADLKISSRKPLPKENRTGKQGR